MKHSKKAFREPYEAREDTLLLIKHMKKYATGKDYVLEMGTGSGVVAIEACKYAKKVLAVDINPKAITLAKKNAKKIVNITIKKSDLFSNIKKEEKFNLIVFNPPYLPYHKDDPDIALDGGKHGYELLGKFLNNVNPFLKKEGKILVVFSTFTRPEKVKEFIFKNGFEFKELDIDHILFEDLFLWEIKKSKLLKSLENKEIEKVKYFTKGHRGYIYQGKLKKDKIMIKINNPKSTATNRIENEVNFLKRIEKYNIAPKVLLYENNTKIGEYFVYKFIKGEFIGYFTEDKKTKKNEIIEILKKVMEQMYLLDKLGINKEEMHRPIRHIIIDSKLNVKLIDFERANMTKKPKNVTQFCQFLISTKFNEVLRKKKINIDMKEMIKLTQEYKTKINDKSFKKILKLIK